MHENRETSLPTARTSGSRAGEGESRTSGRHARYRHRTEQPRQLCRYPSKVRAVCVNRACTDLCRVVSRTRCSERGAVPEMKEDPSEPAYRRRLQTAVSCCRPMTVVVNVTEKA